LPWPATSPTPASAEAAIAKASKAHGPARVLVNCAGIGVAKRVIGRDGPMALADFDRVIKVNLIGSFNMLRLATAKCQSSSRWRRRARRRHLHRVGRGL
jgi:NAD(P)-dependent dehydrogenase (short-subunit alcohol dehydrogenase family)